MPSFSKSCKVLYVNVIYFYFLLFTLTLCSSLVEKHLFLLIVILWTSRQYLMVPMFLQSLSDLGFSYMLILPMFSIIWMLISCPIDSLVLASNSVSMELFKTLFWFNCTVVHNKSLLVLAFHLILIYSIRWIQYLEQCLTFREKNFTQLTKTK